MKRKEGSINCNKAEVNITHVIRRGGKKAPPRLPGGRLGRNAPRGTPGRLSAPLGGTAPPTEKLRARPPGPFPRPAPGRSARLPPAQGTAGYLPPPPRQRRAWRATEGHAAGPWRGLGGIGRPPGRPRAQTRRRGRGSGSSASAAPQSGPAAAARPRRRRSGAASPRSGHFPRRPQS
jgi:hypothetical protein